MSDVVPGGGRRSGWTGRRLRVDLSGGGASIEPIPPDHLDAYIGGRGLNSRTLFDYQRPGIDPLGQENPLIFGVGPVNGTLIPSSGRFTVTAFSPLTVVGDDAACMGDSNAGGFWGPELKFAGFDQLIVEGAADEPVYLVIRDRKVEVRSAAHLWGMTTWETEDAILRELGDPGFRVASIGPAGENLVRVACIMNHRHRASGKCGLGAVMGSKRLKAVAIRGSGSVSVADTGAVWRVVDEALAELRRDPYAQVYARQGTSSLVRAHQAQGRMPTRNYQQTQFAAWESLTAEHFAEHHWTRSRSCFGCPIHCAHSFEVRGGPYAGTVGEGPEYVSIGAFGTKVGVEDSSAVLRAHNLCNQLGLDTLNTGSTIAWAMECWQEGVMGPADTDGLSLGWGNAETVVTLVERIARREGDLADLLAEGAYRAAQRLGHGSSRWVAHAKGQDPALSDPRVAKAWGLGYATASRGGCHLRALPTAETYYSAEEAVELFGTAEAVSPTGVKGKGRLVRWSEDQRAAADSLEVCKFVVRTSLMRPEWEARFLSAVTGLEWSGEDVMAAGERITNVERAINVLQGLTRADDCLSERLMNDPVSDGPAKGEVLDLEPMLDEYYVSRGWDLVSGYPSADTLERLGMHDVAARLGAEDKLAPARAVPAPVRPAGVA